MLTRVEMLEDGLRSLEQTVLDIRQLLQNNPGSIASQPAGKGAPVCQGESMFREAPGEKVLSEAASLRNSLMIDVHQDSHALHESVSTTLQADAPSRGSDGVSLFSSNTRAVTTLGPLHPQPADIHLIWQTYLDNVDPLIKIFHVPTIQKTICRAARDVNNLDSPTECLMFAIYYSTVVTMSAEDCRSTFDDERTVLLNRYDYKGPVMNPPDMKRYRTGVELALKRIDMMESRNLTVLKAFILYLVSCPNFSLHSLPLKFSDLRKTR